MKKQDRQGVRTPAELEQKYDLAGAQKVATEARQAAAEAKRAAADAQAALNALTVPKDYIVERGVSGSWTYEKWASGKAVCWCSASIATYYNTAQGNNTYSANLSYAFPDGLFVSSPSYAHVSSIAVEGTESEKIVLILPTNIEWRAFVGAVGAVTRNVTFLIEARGLWKGEST